MAVLAVSRRGARRFLLESLLLGPGPRPAMPLLERIRRLEAVQIDPVARVGRNQDLALTIRHPRYTPAALDRLLRTGAVFEYIAQEASVLPMDDFPVLEGVRRRQSARLRPHLDRLPAAVGAVLARIERDGPLPSRAFVSENRVMGYWDLTEAATKETSHVLNLLFDSGRLMVVRREGTTRHFDLPERVVPPALLAQARQITVEEADELLSANYFRAYRLVRGTDPRLGWAARTGRSRRERLADRVQSGRAVPVAVSGVKTPYYVLAEDVERLEYWDAKPRGFTRSIRFIPPLDNLLWDRARVADLFDFHYRWEIYVPPEKRKFGVYAMPVLAGDRFIGRIDPVVDRQEKRLRVEKAVWEPGVKMTPHLLESVERAVEEWGRRLGAETVTLPEPL